MNRIDRDLIRSILRRSDTTEEAVNAYTKEMKKRSKAIKEITEKLKEKVCIHIDPSIANHLFM